MHTTTHTTTPVTSFRNWRLPVVALAVALAAAVALAQDSDLLQSPPPAPYVAVSSILPLPDFIPGAGALYIDPADAPVGPWLAYGKDGDLVEVLFMVPVSEMQKAANWSDLAAGLFARLGKVVDHVDISYNGGHPGMAEPHYHVRLTLVDAKTQAEQLAQ
jgi:hypothetical protein